MGKPAAWELRRHPFRGEWILYASHRGGRPWIGDRVAVAPVGAPSHDPACALCPGTTRVGGKTNPAYAGPYWFENDLPPFGPLAPDLGDGDELYQVRPALGTSEVVCYHPDHGKTFADLAVEEASAVVDLWAERTAVHFANPSVRSVLIFENKGSLVGTSNPHPHCQIYAGNVVFGLFEREAVVASEYFRSTGSHVGAAVAAREGESGRVIADHGAFFASVPWFARYAYEVVVLPRRSVTKLTDLGPFERRVLAKTLREVAIRYDNLWRRPMPYVMAIHQAPTQGDHPAFPFHVVYQPPLRAPDTLKYLAGPEIGGGTMTNESDPDARAAELKAASPERKPFGP
jgi:UDPglucose--hexose-1-phosphate uridylyltransferase